MNLILLESEIAQLHESAVWDNRYTSETHCIKMYQVLGLQYPSELMERIIARNTYKIHKYVPEAALTRDPANIIFPEMLTSSPEVVYGIVDGERISSIYSIDGEPIIKVDYTFERDSNNLFALSRTQVIRWYTMDGNLGAHVKTVVSKYTNRHAQRKELRARRANIIVEMEVKAEQLGLATAIKDMYSKFSIEVSKYEQAGSGDLASALLNDTELDWLNQPSVINPEVTIRQYLISKFSIGVI